jgi:hypothetical protein
MNSYSSGYHAFMRDHIDHILMEEPEFAAVCYQYIKDLRGGSFDQELVDAIFQPWERHYINIYDAYLFASIWTGLCYGEILWTSLEIGETPGKDKAVAENNQVLESIQLKTWYKRTLDQQQSTTDVTFWAHFKGGNGIGDGVLAWEKPLTVGVNSPIYGPLELQAEPGSAPLEVGYTRISTTMYHLNHERCLARWPYNSTSLYIFYCTEQWPSPWTTSSSRQERITPTAQLYK